MGSMPCSSTLRNWSAAGASAAPVYVVLTDLFPPLALPRSGSLRSASRPSQPHRGAPALLRSRFYAWHPGIEHVKDSLAWHTRATVADDESAVHVGPQGRLVIPAKLRRAFRLEI